MYNMEISIGSYKFRLEILLLIAIVYWIMFGHILCSCSRVGIIEGLEMAKKLGRKTVKKHNLSKNPVYQQLLGERNTNTEGFVGSNNMATGPEFAGAKTPDYIMNPSTWSMPTLTYSPGTTPDTGVQSIWDRPKQQIPLPEGELDMFAKMDFKPECCPNAYSSSTGCACMDVNSYNYLRQRGGNNVPYSEY
jgi:hypothetical protein